ncbi:LPS export ABC transporter periplasmic protein LptC [Comamonas sp.]|uniref:LPS export ABC transporter periplasmic protein LptC n=1 Tax=Comamonas sp. TaxID=34028 RepID=UPI002899E3E9|nr:LPS export ABC transporter periplasmic protein LptC [Comamonas sp.]
MKKTLQRMWEQASIYLPVLLMAMLAMGTWWLVRNAPKPLQSNVDQVVSDAPDYVMDNFSVHQFDGTGRLQSVMTGEQARHFPKTDTMEVDDVRTRSIALNGMVTMSSADRGISNSDSSEVQLIGNAKVERVQPQQPGLTTRYTGEFLHAWTNEERVESHLPVVLTRGKNQFTGDRMKYDNLSQVVELNGRVKGIIYSDKNK